ncbi:MAG: ABC transporter permease [Alphaproteobacteria bacterium]|nr:ABC transporter permease [Rickettsiales bacterium]
MQNIKKFFLTSFHIAVKNLKQLRYQRGTLVMTILAPTFSFYIMFIALNGSDSKVELATYKEPRYFLTELHQKGNGKDGNEVNYKSTSFSNLNEMMNVVNNGDFKFALDFSKGDKPVLYVSGTSFLSNQTGIQVVSKIMQISQIRSQMQQQSDIANSTHNNNAHNMRANVAMQQDSLASLIEDPVIDVVYTNNIGAFSMFEMTGPSLTGITIIFFVFIVSGISFLREKLSGTMERLLISPVSVKELICGYTVSFGLLSVLQIAIFQLFYYQILRLNGNADLMLLFSFSFFTIICSLTFGFLVSSFAKTEFQVMQIVPVFLVPQIALSGMFDLPDSLLQYSRHLPMTYAVVGFKKMILEGATAFDIRLQITGLLGYSILFIVLTHLALNKYKPKLVKSS